jgi:hypothetical protein
MPGYSGTPLLKKLGIKPGMKVMLINEPENGLVDVKVCAVSDIWSGLKLVVPFAKR